MKHLGIDVTAKHLPPLDPAFVPLGRFYEAFLQDAKEPFDVAVERSGGQVAVYHTRVHGTQELAGGGRATTSTASSRPCCG